ncbi:MAG: hypothetical protein BWK72_12410 [Rhodoferax ferrireducens]|uniref:Uncharacterized protein n=1 Tax=Rhodoferax ferrireducens TaxID=192843 RepID=A0A1W9KTG0_9BURK|nr:MAG: hypothetical protein BWK72_12410 [Rhodoferax ferrireducens]
MGAIQAGVVSRKANVSRQTRRGDWVMRMRFRGENTRETEGSERQRLWARAFHPEARSHNPITAPDCFGVKTFSPTASLWFGAQPD